MNDWKLASVFVAVAIGYFCLGWLWQIRRVHFWRIKWIEMEHALARCEHREPRDIESVKLNTNVQRRSGDQRHEPERTETQRSTPDSRAFSVTTDSTPTFNLMKYLKDHASFAVICSGGLLCIAGATLCDRGIPVTGITCIILGFFLMGAGPMALDLDK